MVCCTAHVCFDPKRTSGAPALIFSVASLTDTMPFLSLGEDNEATRVHQGLLPVTWPLAARAQQKSEIPRFGFVYQAPKRRWLFGSRPS